MKSGVLLLLLLLPVISLVTAQTSWKLSKDKDGIQIYSRSSDSSKYKSVRVRCELTGSISKLYNILRDVKHHPDWVYKAKNIAVIKQPSPDDITYYLETEIPWPVSNRDGVYHLTMKADTSYHTFTALVVSLPGYVPEKDGKVRILHSKATWLATEKNDKLQIDYTFEVDPGGGLPAWAVNLLSDKGPYETFKNLEALLKKQ